MQGKLGKGQVYSLHWEQSFRRYIHSEDHCLHTREQLQNSSHNLLLQAEVPNNTAKWTHCWLSKVCVTGLRRETISCTRMNTLTSPLRRQNLKGMNTDRYAKVKARKVVEPDKKNCQRETGKQSRKMLGSWALCDATSFCASWLSPRILEQYRSVVVAWNYPLCPQHAPTRMYCYSSAVSLLFCPVVYCPQFTQDPGWKP